MLSPMIGHSHQELTSLVNLMEKTKMDGTKIISDFPAMDKAHSEMQSNFLGGMPPEN